MIYAIFANIPCIFIIFKIMHKKRVISEKFIETIIGAIIAYIITIIVGNIFQGFVGVIDRSRTILVLGTLVEEISKIVILMFLSRKQIDKYQVVVFGLTFALIENFGLSYTDFSMVVLRGILWFTHSATLIIFAKILYLNHKTKLAYLFGIFAAVLIHILHNLLTININVFVFGFYLAILYNFTLEIFKELPNNY
ncbi:hypothetical protein [Holdemania filiformis]|nr:hypothetical protein [Holdemania filiformis]MCQ4952676.1 hypothetical protein [Holdemania filiformis]